MLQELRFFQRTLSAKVWVHLLAAEGNWGNYGAATEELPPALDRDPKCS
jgi:hypothetical protein